VYPSHSLLQESTVLEFGRSPSDTRPAPKFDQNANILVRQNRKADGEGDMAGSGREKPIKRADLAACAGLAAKVRLGAVSVRSGTPQECW
jgi:hypothetical protein